MQSTLNNFMLDYVNIAVPEICLALKRDEIKIREIFNKYIFTFPFNINITVLLNKNLTNTHDSFSLKVTKLHQLFADPDSLDKGNIGKNDSLLGAFRFAFISAVNSHIKISLEALNGVDKIIQHPLPQRPAPTRLLRRFCKMHYELVLKKYHAVIVKSLDFTIFLNFVIEVPVFAFEYRKIFEDRWNEYWFDHGKAIDFLFENIKMDHPLKWDEFFDALSQYNHFKDVVALFRSYASPSLSESELKKLLSLHRGKVKELFVEHHFENLLLYLPGKHAHTLEEYHLNKVSFKSEIFAMEQLLQRISETISFAQLLEALQYHPTLVEEMKKML